MNKLEGIQIFSLALKIVVPLFLFVKIIKVINNSGSEKKEIKQSLRQMVISATGWFIVFFAAAWLWVHLRQIGASGPEYLIACARSGIVGFLLGALIGLFADERKRNRTHK